MRKLRSILAAWFLIAACSAACAQSLTTMAIGWSGVITVSTSVTLSTANATMSGSTTIPVPISMLHILNSGTNTGIVCPFGGACSASAGGIVVPAGVAIDLNLSGQKTAPTLFSTSGTTFSVWGT